MRGSSRSFGVSRNTLADWIKKKSRRDRRCRRPCNQRRPMTGIVGDYERYGSPDAVIAKGLYSPKIPYFCFHEYKKENEPKGDPAAQARSAMLAAQALKHRPHPIYGLYAVGKLGHFLLLQGQEDVVSAGFLADGKALFEIVKLLKALKAILSEIAKQDA